MRTCTHCGEAKPEQGFYWDKSQGRFCSWCRECMAVTSRARKHTPEYRWAYCKKAAERRGLIFELTVENFREDWNAPCAYCGERIDGVGYDRVDNTEGYVVSNSLPCCSTCNGMKSDQGLLDFIERCHKIASRLHLGLDSSIREGASS